MVLTSDLNMKETDHVLQRQLSDQYMTKGVLSCLTIPMVLFDISKKQVQNPSKNQWSVSVGLSLNSIYFLLSIYTWQHTSIQIHGKWIRKEVT